MSQFDPIIIGIVVVSILIIGGIVLSFTFSQGPAVPQYKISDSERPQIETKETSFDFGKVKLSEIKTEEIQIQNKGSQALVISNMITSCDCTSAQLIINGKEEPKFSMRSDTKWRGEISAGQSAVLKIIYTPSLMPVQGKVDRAVYFKTNDPQVPSVNITFSADVQ